MGLAGGPPLRSGAGEGRSSVTQPAGCGVSPHVDHEQSDPREPAERESSSCSRLHRRHQSHSAQEPLASLPTGRVFSRSSLRRGSDPRSTPTAFGLSRSVRRPNPLCGAIAEGAGISITGPETCAPRSVHGEADFEAACPARVSPDWEGELPTGGNEVCCSGISVSGRVEPRVGQDTMTRVRRPTKKDSRRLIRRAGNLACQTRASRAACSRGSAASMSASPTAPTLRRNQPSSSIAPKAWKGTAAKAARSSR